MPENTTVPSQPNEVREFLEVVDKLHDAVDEGATEVQYYLEQYLESKFGIAPKPADVTPAPATPTDTTPPADTTPTDAGTPAGDPAPADQTPNPAPAV